MHSRTRGYTTVVAGSSDSTATSWELNTYSRVDESNGFLANGQTRVINSGQDRRGDRRGRRGAENAGKLSSDGDDAVGPLEKLSEGSGKQ